MESLDKIVSRRKSTGTREILDSDKAHGPMVPSTSAGHMNHLHQHHHHNPHHHHHHYHNPAAVVSIPVRGRIYRSFPIPSDNTAADEYDREVVQSAKQIRTYVTNKLILDSTHPDPRVRLRCYEMLGKISDVGLFTDKTEVTMRHRPTEELEQLLRERLMKTIEAMPESPLTVLEAQDASSSDPK